MVHRSKLSSFGPKFLSLWLEPKTKELMIHIENAPAHSSRMEGKVSEHNPLKRLPRPSDSPDICPLDFYLFGKVKGALIGQEIPDEISLLDAVTEILSIISTDKLQRVSHSRIKCVENVITVEWSYASEKISCMSLFDVSSSALWLV
jgi:hypothetical protein